MCERHLHIISFDIPYPANYGGVIDVFYKLHALKKAGIKVHLHCFEYWRKPSEVLNGLCHKIHYYPRNTGLRAALSLDPYIVVSRRSDQLLRNLASDDHPILFEGLHSCYYLDHPMLSKRMKIYRESNIEHQYYYNLAKVDPNPLKKLYFIIASIKLRNYQRVLKHASLILAVSKADVLYLRKKFRSLQVEFLPSFHPNYELQIPEGTGDYVLYHGNLQVAENLVVAEFLIRKVFSHSHHRFVLAGMNPPITLQKLVQQYPNIELYGNPSDKQLFDLIRNAQVHVLITFQATGLKLKLLNTLYNGRHVIVNDAMLNGTGLEQLCHISNTPAEIISAVNKLSVAPLSNQARKLRFEALDNGFSNEKNTDKLIGFIFGKGNKPPMLTL